MKINKINSENIVTFKPKTNTHNTNSKTNEVINNPLDKTPSNPKYYQAINNISFQSNVHYLAVTIKNKTNEETSLKLRIPITENDSATFNLNANEAEILLDENKRPDNNKIAIFIELFEEFFKLRKQKQDKERAIIQKIINKKEENITSIDIQNDVINALSNANSENDDDFIENFLLGIKDEKERKHIGIICLEKNNEKAALNAVLAAKEALCILRLSKKGNEIDLSELDKKINIAVLLEYINAECETDFTDTFIEAITKNGKADLELAKHVINYMQLEKNYGLTKNSIKDYAQTIKKIAQDTNPFATD